MVGRHRRSKRWQDEERRDIANELRAARGEIAGSVQALTGAMEATELGELGPVWRGAAWGHTM